MNLETLSDDGRKAAERAKPAKCTQKRNRHRPKKRLTESYSTARLARDELMSIKCRSKPVICKIALPTFTQTFFPQKDLPEYSRLLPISKLLICQFVLNDLQTDDLQSIPFVFRLPTILHNTDLVDLRKKIQRKLSAALNRPVLFWMTAEYDNRKTKSNTHLNGEILISPQELETTRKAFNSIYHGQIQATKPTKAIHFPISSRNKEIAQHGKFYGVFNWASYATKQEEQRQTDNTLNRLKGLPPDEKQNFHYISKDLNKLAANLYKNL